MQLFRSISLAAMAVALMASTSAHAATQEGLYLTGMGIMPFQSDADTEVAGQPDSELEYKTGWGLSGAAGYAWGNGLRTELELAYRHSALQESHDGTVVADGGGLHNMALMANAIYDFKTVGRLTPYLGLGVGGSHVDADNLRNIAGTLTVDDDEYVFAYQAIAGFALQLEGNWSFLADYRYFATPDVEFTARGGNKVETENASHSIMIGVRYQFGKPAPAPALAPAPAAAPAAPVQPAPAPVPAMPKAQAPEVVPVVCSYVVFFDFDKDNLTPEAQRIIAAAASDYKSGNYVRVVVTGHTDTAGDKKYNEALSIRRANAVRNEFTKLGMSADVVTAVGVGEISPLVPTTDGIREAQNRRAEIVLK